MSTDQLILRFKIPEEVILVLKPLQELPVVGLLKDQVEVLKGILLCNVKVRREALQLEADLLPELQDREQLDQKIPQDQEVRHEIWNNYY